MTSRRLVAIAVAAIVALGAAALVATISTGSGHSTKAQKNAVVAHPPPPLYADARLGGIDRMIAPEEARGRRLARRWLHAHPTAGDQAFIAWAVAQAGPAPTAATRRAELPGLRRLAAARTPAGDAAARWLEAYAKKLWKLYAKQRRQLIGHRAGDPGQALVKRTLKLSDAVTAAVKARYPSSTPYELDRGLVDLRAGKDQAAALRALDTRGARRRSFPSKHAVAGAAAAGVLSTLEPRRAAEFRWTERQIDFSRLYAGGHAPSDVETGAFLGALVAEYELARGGHG
jgi:hypothetical protein